MAHPIQYPVAMSVTYQLLHKEQEQLICHLWGKLRAFIPKPYIKKLGVGIFRATYGIGMPKFQLKAMRTSVTKACLALKIQALASKPEETNSCYFIMD